MISLFRQIRQKLLAQNRISRYLTYAIGEIFLVVIGILIALQVNNWNENRKDRLISEDTIVALRIELQEALVELKQVYQHNSENRRLSQQYINGEANLDSLLQAPHKIFSYTGYAFNTLNLPILERELSTDKRIQGKDELVHLLRAIQNEYNTIQSIIMNMERFWSNQVAPYYTKTNTMVVYNQFLNQNKIELESLLPILHDQEYKNLVAAINSFSFLLVNRLNNLQEKINTILSYLESIKD